MLLLDSWMAQLQHTDRRILQLTDWISLWADSVRICIRKTIQPFKVWGKWHWFCYYAELKCFWVWRSHLYNSCEQWPGSRNRLKPLCLASPGFAKYHSHHRSYSVHQGSIWKIMALAIIFIKCLFILSLVLGKPSNKKSGLVMEFFRKGSEPPPLYFRKGVAESEAHCINADANHTWSKFSQFFFPADIFHFDANERIYFCFQEFPTFT